MRGRLISMSATVMMQVMLVTTPADVQSIPEEIQVVQKNIEQDTEPLTVQPPQISVIERPDYTSEEIALIKRLALAEGQTEGADGMWLIMSVIVNRVADPDFPDTVTGVVNQKNAFSSLKDGNFDRVPDTTDEAEEAWQRIADGDICPKIVAFETIKSNVLDTWFLEAFTYRHHKFYTKKDDQWG